MPFAYSSPLNDAQLHAASHNFGPMLVRAGAGTGKTTVLVQRIYRLVRQGIVPANQVLAITYTNAAAEEMRDRLHGLLGSDADGLCAYTFHGYCNSILREHSRQFHLLSKEDLWVYLRRNIGSLGLEYFSKAADPGVFLNTLMSFFDRCSDELVSCADYSRYVEALSADANSILPRVGESSKDGPPTREQTIARCREIARVFARVEQMLARQSVGSFGALIVRTARLLQENATALHAAQKSARMILVDEFQDTNHSQLEIVRLLAGAEGNVFVVGDPDQAIYRFRGASAGAFDDFRRAFPSSVSVTLAENQRSTPPILHCANEIIRRNPSSGFPREALRSGREGRGNRRPNQVHNKMRLLYHDGKEREAQQAARMVLERVEASGEAWSEFAILYRGNATAPDLIKEFGSLNVPVDVSAADLLETEQGRDIMAALRAMVSLDDNVALFRLAMMPRFGLDARAVQGALNGRHSVAGALGKFAEGKQFLESVNELRKQSGAEDEDALTTVKRALELFGYGDRLEAHYLLRCAREWREKPCVGAAGTSGKLADFMDYLALWRKAGGTLRAEERDVLGARLHAEAEPNAVKLMSVHAAKGLEFKHAIIVRAASGSFPNNYQQELFSFPPELRKSNADACDDKALHAQEERRLFYVAVTRAKDSLAILGKSPRGKDPVPSLFMRELRDTKNLKDILQVEAAAPYVVPDVQASAALEWHQLPATLDPATLKLSASAIDAYDSCPKKYYFQYEWRLPFEPNAVTQYGSAVHLSLRDLYRSAQAQRTMSEAELLATFEGAFRDYENTIEDRHQFEMFLQQGRRVLSAFYRQEILDRPLPRILGIEEMFDFKIDDVAIHGRMDRVDATDAGLVVLDYKTGGFKSEELARKSTQLSVYALAAAHKHQQPVAQVGFYNLEANAPAFAERSARELAAVREKILTVADGIRSGDFTPKVDPHGSCKYCGYRTLCPETAEKIFNLARPESPQTITEPQLSLF